MRAIIADRDRSWGVSLFRDESKISAASCTDCCVNSWRSKSDPLDIKVLATGEQENKPKLLAAYYRNHPPEVLVKILSFPSLFFAKTASKSGGVPINGTASPAESTSL
jgi:hypothetical protein